MDVVDSLNRHITYTVDYLESISLSDRDEEHLIEALKSCAPQNGDEWIIWVVMEVRGVIPFRPEAPGHTEFREFLRDFTISRHDLSILGRDWEGVVRLARKTASLSPEMMRAVREAWDSSAQADRDTARRDAQGVVLGANMSGAHDCARYVVWNSGSSHHSNESWDFFWEAASDAVLAMVVKGLISHDHYERLVRPWFSVFPSEGEFS